MNARVGARNSRCTWRCACATGTSSPIEFNPLRFAGLGGTDVSWLAYGFRTYAAFLDGEALLRDDVFRGKEGKVYSMSLLTPPAGAPAGARFDYAGRRATSGSPTCSRCARFDVQPRRRLRLPVPGDRCQDTADELDFLKNTDLKEFLR